MLLSASIAWLLVMAFCTVNKLTIQLTKNLSGSSTIWRVRTNSVQAVDGNSNLKFRRTSNTKVELCWIALLGSSEFCYSQSTRWKILVAQPSPGLWPALGLQFFHQQLTELLGAKHPPQPWIRRMKLFDMKPSIAPSTLPAFKWMPYPEKSFLRFMQNTSPYSNWPHFTKQPPFHRLLHRLSKHILA